MTCVYRLAATVLLRAGAWCARRADGIAFDDVIEMVFGPPARTRP